VGYKSFVKYKTGCIYKDSKQETYFSKTLFLEQNELLEMKVDLTIPQITFTNVKSKDSRSFTLFEWSQQQPVYVFATMDLKGLSLIVE